MQDANTKLNSLRDSAKTTVVCSKSKDDVLCLFRKLSNLALTLLLCCVQIITQNQDRFVQMLNEPVTEPLAPGAAGGGQAGGQIPGVGGMQMPEEASYIHVTQEEKQAIDRVSASAFTAYF